MKLVYTTCSTKMAESILNNSFRVGGYVETYTSLNIAIKMAHPMDEWLIVLNIPTEFSVPAIGFAVTINCSEGIPDGFLQGLIKLNATTISEVLDGLNSMEV